MLESSTTVVHKNSDSWMVNLIECQYFLEYMPVVIAMFDREMCYLLASQRWQETFGVVGTKGTVLYDHCPGKSEIWREIQSACVAGEVTTWEEAVTDANGIWQWVTWKVQPWYDESGLVGGAIVCAETITNFKQIEDLLKQSFQELEDLKLALDHASILAMIDPQGIITHINDVFCEISQYSREEFLGKTYQSLTSNYHTPQFFQDLWTTISGGLIWQGEIKHRGKDGTIYWLETTIVPSLDSQGKPYQYIAISHDITEQKQIEQQLQESQQFLQRVLDHIPQQIFWKDRHSVYLGCNQKGATIAGLNSPAEIIGKVDYDLPWTTEEADWYHDGDCRVMESGKARLHRIETQKQADGQVAWLETNKIPLHNADGEVVGILVTIEDITDRKQAEERLQKANEELENRVTKRTVALQAVIDQLNQVS